MFLVNLRQLGLGSPRKREPQWRNHLAQTGHSVGIFLTDDWCGRAQLLWMAVAWEGSLGYVRKQTEQVSKQNFSMASASASAARFLPRAPALKQALLPSVMSVPGHRRLNKPSHTKLLMVFITAIERLYHGYHHFPKDASD